jgi:hypothetical protein
MSGLGLLLLLLLLLEDALLSIGVSGRVHCSGIFGEGCLSVVLLMCVGVGITL